MPWESDSLPSLALNDGSSELYATEPLDVVFLSLAKIYVRLSINGFIVLRLKKWLETTIFWTTFISTLTFKFVGRGDFTLHENTVCLIMIYSSLIFALVHLKDIFGCSSADRGARRYRAIRIENWVARILQAARSHRMKIRCSTTFKARIDGHWPLGFMRRCHEKTLKRKCSRLIISFYFICILKGKNYAIYL